MAGYSPSQWVLGFQPSLPGDFVGDGLNPAHLGGSASFEQILECRTAAKVALIKSDQDQKLRRALLRRYAGTNMKLEPGQVCFYWRDGRATDLVKIRWNGPAKVILREDSDDGLPLLYWIAHGTQLIRCAPHHLRPDFRTAAGSTAIGGLADARQAVIGLKSRGVTRFLDLNRVNKRSYEEVQTDEEEFPDELGPPLQRPRLNVPTPALAPEAVDDVMDQLLNDDDYSPTSPADTVQIPADEATEDPLPALPPVTAPNQLVDLTTGDEPEPAKEPSVPPSVSSPHRQHPGLPPSHLQPQPEPSHLQSQPGLSSSMPVAPPPPTLDPATAALYEPAGPETFEQRRRRIDRQETLQLNRPFGPAPNPLRHSAERSEPYAESFAQTFEIEDAEVAQLPPGWSVDQDGFFQLTDVAADFWEVRAGCLLRQNLVPRHSSIDVTKFKDVPIDPQYLDPVRITVMRDPSGQINVWNDDGTTPRSTSLSWTGVTVFQITGPARKELCMYANLPARKVGRQAKTQLQRQVKKKDSKKTVVERQLSANDRALFQEAKIKELRSFFEHNVWHFDSAENADPARTLTARMLLTWSKNPDGSPRAKARLIVRGFSDVDALQGQLETSSPTTMRLSRNVLLSLASNMSWTLWTADVS